MNILGNGNWDHFRILSTWNQVELRGFEDQMFGDGSSSRQKRFGEVEDDG